MRQQLIGLIVIEIKNEYSRQILNASCMGFILNQLIAQDLIPMNTSQSLQKQTLLKTKQWQSMHADFNCLQHTVRLLETAPNAKHQKLTLSIEVISETLSTLYHKQFKTSDLPTQAVTIFSDVETLFDYLDQFSNDSARIKFDPQEGSFTIVNIVVMKNKELKQEIVLFLDTQAYEVNKNELEDILGADRSFLNESQISTISSKQLLEESKTMMESLLKDKNAELENKINKLNEHLNSFITEIRTLRSQNKVFSNALNSCNVNITKLQKQNLLLHEKISQIERQKANIQDVKKTPEPHAELSHHVHQLKKQLSDSKWQIDQLDNSFTNMRESQNEVQKFRLKVQQQLRNQPKNDQILPLVNEMRKQIVIMNSKWSEMKENTSRLGAKMFIILDTKYNKYVGNFSMIENIIEKVAGDEQRHQLLGMHPFNIMQLKTKSYFEIKIIAAANAQVVVGVVGENRRGERYSYDKQECICYDGQGFIFEQGHKIKMPCQFQNGQTIKVVLDPVEALIHWFVGYTEVGSALIPESMRKIKVLPYFELYCKNDKIAING